MSEGIRKGVRGHDLSGCRHWDLSFMTDRKFALLSSFGGREATATATGTRSEVGLVWFGLVWFGLVWWFGAGLVRRLFTEQAIVSTEQSVAN
jgi:hypothetical protein